MNSLNFVNLIQAGTSAVSILGIFLLWREKDLKGIALFLGLIAVAPVVNILEETGVTRHWHLISPVFIMFFGPATYLAAKSAINKKLNKRDYWHLVPAAPFLIFTSHIQIVIALGTIWRLIYTYFTVSMLLNYKRQIDEQRSDSDEYSLNWLMWLLIFSILFMLADLLRLNLQPHIPVELNILGQGINNFYGLLVSMVIIYKFSNLKGLPTPVEKQLVLTEKNKCTNLDYQPIFEELEKLITENSWYLKPRLTLSDVSELTGFNTRDISRSINLHTHNSFNEYINKFRINKVCEVLEAGSKKSLKDVAFDCGFSSKASFNNLFKQVVGSTPSEYRLSIKSRS